MVDLPHGTKMFQVYESDLQKLEKALPELLSLTLPACNNPRVQVLWQEVRDVIADIRWDYGPPSEVHVIPASEGAK